MKNEIEAMITDITATTAEAEDYTGEDGLLYCGKCHTPKKKNVFTVLSLFQQTSLHDSCVSCRSNASILFPPHAGRQCPNTTEYGKSV